jgi:hypothetical protein
VRQVGLRGTDLLGRAGKTRRLDNGLKALDLAKGGAHVPIHEFSFMNI